MKSRFLAALAALIATTAPAAGQLPKTQKTAPPVSSPTDVTADAVILAADRLRANRWYAPAEVETSPSMDLRILTFAVSAPTPELRRVAVRALGWMENPKDIQVIAERLSDSDISVRLTAAQAITQCLWNAKGDAVTVARIALEGQLFVEPDAIVKGALYETLGSLPYGANDNMGRIEGLLRTPFMISPMLPEWMSGLRGIEIFTRRNPGYGLDAATIKRVRELATDGVLKIQIPTPPTFMFPVLTALQVIQNIKDNDTEAIHKAVRYHCFGPGCGWQIRLIGLQMLDSADDIADSLIDAVLSDEVYQVRHEALTKKAHNIEKTGTCQPLIDALDDRDPHIVQHAIELLNPKCAERDDLTKRLVQWVGMLTDPLNDEHWQQPVAALKTLVKFDPDTAHALAKSVASTHHVWQVRMAGVHVADALMDEDMAVQLASHDPDVPIGFLEANVRTEALKTLRRMNSKALPDAAIAALTENDYQLLITASTLLKNTARHDAVKPLLDALTRLTSAEPGIVDPPADTSREARLAILARLQELGTTDDYPQLALKPYLTDVDPLVASGAADVIATFAGARPAPQPTKRAPMEPTGVALQPFPAKCAAILLDHNRTIVIQLATANAPVSAARFLMLADSKFYDGTTFYRFEPNQFALAGSPGSNLYSGTDRFIRDEMGLPNTFGAVALSNRGRDMGDGQFFIDLSDQPGFDHEYTVFGSVLPSVTVDVRSALDDIVEGTKIVTVRSASCKVR